MQERKIVFLLETVNEVPITDEEENIIIKLRYLKAKGNDFLPRFIESQLTGCLVDKKIGRHTVTYNDEKLLKLVDSFSLEDLVAKFVHLPGHKMDEEKLLDKLHQLFLIWIRLQDK
jgi:hypothetical protein